MDVRSNVVEASSSEALAQKQGERAEDDVMFQVFDNPSLREEILKHVIFGKDRVDRKAACVLRLVDKSWNESVIRILRKAHEPLFRLGGRSREAMELFVERFAASSEVMGSVPPLAVACFGDLSYPENLERFSDCVIRCGNGLMQLRFNVNENGRPFQNSRLPTNLSFPCLHRLVVVVQLNFRDNQSQGHGELAIEEDDDKISTCLIKSVLSNATALDEIGLVIDSRSPVPPERSQFTLFESVILPPSLTKILTCILGGSTQHLEILARSPLPNLTSLTILVGSVLFSDGFLSRVLDNCRKSLKAFQLGPIHNSRQPGIAHVTRFPVMAQLQELSVIGVNFQPVLGLDSLEKLFPKLRTLRLHVQTVDVFQKWTGSAPVPGVTYLRLSLRQNSVASLNMDTMQRVNFVFPNVRKLEVTLSSEDTSGLQYIFREMRQLTELNIIVGCYMDQSTSPHIWDSLLTGVPVEVIAMSRAYPHFWKKNELNENENVASIKNLTELNKCSFKLFRVNAPRLYIDADGHLRCIPYPSISDFVFNYALLRMPKLKELRLERRSSFNVSQEMIAKWTSDCRSLTFD